MWNVYDIVEAFEFLFFFSFGIYGEENIADFELTAKCELKTKNFELKC